MIDTQNAQMSFSASTTCEKAFFHLNLFRFDGILQQMKNDPSSIRFDVFFLLESKFFFCFDFQWKKLVVHSMKIKRFFVMMKLRGFYQMEFEQFVSILVLNHLKIRFLVISITSFCNFVPNNYVSKSIFVR